MNELLAQKPPKIKGNVSVTIHLGRPDRRRRDIDNLTKAPIDLLQRAGVIEDDCLVDDLHVSWSGIGRSCTVTVKSLREAA